MTTATDFTRYDCQYGERRLRYTRATREYVCGDCSGRIVKLCDPDDPRYPDRWFVACVLCRGHNFIHEYQERKQREKTARVMRTLPSEIVQAYLENKGD